MHSRDKNGGKYMGKGVQDTQTDVGFQVSLFGLSENDKHSYTVS